MPFMSTKTVKTRTRYKLVGSDYSAQEQPNQGLLHTWQMMKT